MKKRSTEDMLLIAIGASAGGIHALQDFFSSFKPMHASVVIVQQLNAESTDMLIDILQHHTVIPVEEIDSHSEIKVGKVYICPPHKFVSIEDDKFVVSETSDSISKFTTIDFFMTSLAQSRGEKSVGILLSGEGMDGVIGLKSISEAGGLTLVQDELSAEHPSMPKNASEMGFVDYVLSPYHIAKELNAYEQFLIKLEKSTSVNQLKEEIGAAIISICDILTKHSQHDFKHYKSSTLVRRIQRRMSVLHIDKVEEYLSTLQHDRNERDALFNDLLINVTSFFRDPEAFDTLKNEVLIPDLKKFTGTKKYRIWVAGCSTGEEPYTIAILVQEALEELKKKVDIQIIATDIDEDALNVARRGDYPPSISEKVSAERLEKYFVRKNGRYSVNKNLREMILFSSHNIINDPPFSQVDIISCRNVLIYLGQHLQKKLIPVFHYALKPNGHLFLGTSEALASHKDLFTVLNAKHRLAQRKATAINMPLQSFFTAMTTSYSAHFKEAPQGHEEDLHLIGQRIILDEFAPRFAIISDENKILSVSAGFQEYMEPSEGTFQNNILKLIKQNLRSPLRISINEAKKEKRQIQNQTAIVRMNKGLIRIGIVVQPMPQLGEHTGLYMVVFKDQGHIPEESSRLESHSGIDATMMDELEKELARLREELDRSVQDLEASNEELKSSNEELLSMNEELQSANEELEVSKEEVQKGNEILSSSNIDLENLLNSTKIATIFLDNKLNIKNFTPAISALYDLVPHDIGRSINSFSSKAVKMPSYSFPKDLKVDEVVEMEVKMPDGRVFLRRKSPYVNQKKEIVGLVVTFVDVTELRRSEILFKTLANTVPQMIFSTDNHGNYNYFSDAWTKYSGLDTSTIKNKGFREIVHPDDLPRTIEAWTQALGTADSFVYEYRLRNKNGEYRWHQLNARSVRDFNGNIYQWFGGCTDIQDHKEMLIVLEDQNKDILRTQERFDGVAKAIDMGVWYCNLPFDILHWSDTVKKHFWCEPNEVITIQKFYEIIHPEDRKPTEDAINYSVQNHTHYDTVYRTVDPKSGKIKYIRAIGWTDYDGEKPIRFDGVTFDITEMTISNNALRDSEWRYTMASRAAREIIWDWNLLSDEVHWNEAIVTQFGYPESCQNTLVEWWIDHVHPDDRQRVTDSIHHAIDNKEEFWKDEYRFLREDGTYASVRDQGYIQIENNVAIRMIGTMYDMTEQNDYMEKMRSAIKARDEFLSIASHELKTPLTSMILKMQMMQRKIERGNGELPSIYESNKLLLKQCGQITSLIDDMLDVSRIANGKMSFSFTKESLINVVTAALDSFSINIEEKNIDVKLNSQEDVEINVDPFRLEQVVSNLLSNAIKYGQGKPIKINIKRVENFGVIEVIDEGLGISKESVQKIFNLFERAISLNISGLGLGLYISKQIVDAHGGEIEVESQLGVGSIFRVIIPIV